MMFAVSRYHTMRSLRQTCTVGVIISVGASAPAGAQRRLLIAGEPQCTTCSIAVAKVITLGTEGDSLLLSARPVVAQGARGRYFAIGNVPRAQVLVYGTSGALVDAFGRPGQGPGELSNVSSIALTPGDSLVVVEAIGRKVSIFSPQGAWVRTYQTRFAPDAVEPVLGGFIAGGVGSVGRQLGQPLHKLSPIGEVLASFGGPIPTLQRRPSSTQRFLATSAVGIWSMRPDRYELEQWSADGVLLTALDRQVSWFPDREVEGARNVWSDPIHPWVRDAHEDKDGVLWVLSIVAGQGFRPTPANYALRTPQDHLEMDSMLEAIDLKSGTLLASQRLPWVANAFTNSGLIVSYHEVDSGIMVVDLLRPAIVRR